MFRRISVALVAILYLVCCNKPDPHPELKDPIYSDLNSILGSTRQTLEAEKKTLADNKKALQEVTPQTGQITRAKKRVDESTIKISKLEQEVAYLELKLEARRSTSNKSYLEAFDKKAPWPDPKEFQSYEIEKKLRNAKRNWDIKERMKELGAEPEKAQKAPSGEE